METSDSLQKVSEENFKLLMRYYQRGTVIPFVGSGFSKKVSGDKFPQWTSFLLSYADQLSVKNDVEDTLQNTAILFRYELAASILAKNDAAFSEKIQDFFALDNKDVISSEALVQWLPMLFPQSPIVTTNLDTVLETVYRNAGKPINQTLYGMTLTDQQLNRITANKEHVLLKIHGCVKDKETIVFSENQYSKLYGALRPDRTYGNKSNKMFPAHFTKMAGDVRFLFLGCSLNEDRYLELLKQIKKRYKEDGNYHFAIISAPDNEKEFIHRQEYLASCGIVPIWYPSGQYKEIQEYFKRMLETKGDVTKSDSYIFSKTLDGRKIASCFIDSLAETAHNNNTDLNLAKAILVQSNEYDSVKKIPSSIVRNLCTEIVNDETACPLIVKGQPGTGKSTLLSLLFLNLPEPIDCYTTLIDLHYYGENRVNNAAYKLTKVLEQISEGINTHKSSILFIDGFNGYDRMNSELEKILMKEIRQWKKKRNVHFVFAVGVLDNNQFPPFIRSREQIPFSASKMIELSPIDITTAEFSFLVEKVLSTLSIIPNQKQVSLKKSNDAKNALMDNVITFCKRITGGIAEFRTVVFTAKQYEIYKDEMFDIGTDIGNVGKIFKEYFLTLMDEETLSCTAEHIAKFMLNRGEKSTPWTNSLVFKSPAFRDFFFAVFYLDSLKSGKEENMAIFNCIFTPSINRFIVALMVQNTDDENKIAGALINNFQKFDVRARNQAAYLLGRVKSPRVKKGARKFLVGQYKELRESLELICQEDDTDRIMLFRSIGISLIYLGNKDYEDDFFSLLINNEKVRDINLKFHIVYYTTDAYKVGDEVKLGETCQFEARHLENLYNMLFRSLDSPDKRGCHGVNIITIISLVIYQQYNNKQVRKKDSFIMLMEELANSTSITSPVLKKYITGIKDHLGEDNIYASIITKFYLMKTIERSGWLQKGREIYKKERVESDADHTWGCCLLAQILLTDRIEDCSFLSQDDRKKYAAEYNKDKVINLLLVHDLPEIYIGDIPVIRQSLDKKEKETVAMQKIAALDAFPCFRSFHKIEQLWNEYEAETDINAGIAYQIDKLEPLVQLYIYRAALPDEQREIQLHEWTKKAMEQLGTCKVQTSFGSNVLEFLSKYLLGKDFFRF
ncbi:MAG: SIR2 family protein [Lachnospiraceae bacterium]|nr:SIR2 family protein [Lachnospiraceae bacterium]